jgi:hypothetical protein
MMNWTLNHTANEATPNRHKSQWKPAITGPRPMPGRSPAGLIGWRHRAQSRNETVR